MVFIETDENSVCLICKDMIYPSGWVECKDNRACDIYQRFIDKRNNQF